MILGAIALEGRTGREAGRMILRKLYRKATDGAPFPKIEIADRGKPYFVDSPWHFSISHTKKWAFCALAQQPVGIDAEEMDRNIDLRLAEKILSPGEREQYDAAPDKRLALLKFWVLKEAAAKLTGEGLRGYPNHTNFRLDDPALLEMEGCILAVLTENEGEYYAF